MLLPSDKKEQAEIVLQSYLYVPQIISQDKHGREQSYDHRHKKEQAQEKERVGSLASAS